MEVICHSCKIPVKHPTNHSCQTPKRFICNACLLNQSKNSLLESATHGNKTEVLSKLASIDRTPIKCPVTKCGHRMCITSILSHFTNEECIPVDFTSVQDGAEIELDFSSDSLPSDGRYCIGGLLYEYQKQRLSLPNSVHNIRYEKYKNHLPIMIMAAKCNLRTLLFQNVDKSKGLSKKDEILLFWMVSPQTSIPVFVKLFIQKEKFGKGVTISVKDVRQEQTLEEFLHEDTNYLYLTTGEMNSLRDQEGKIRLKIKIFVSNDE